MVREMGEKEAVRMLKIITENNIKNIGTVENVGDVDEKGRSKKARRTNKK